MKKVISIVVIFSMNHLTSCYYQEHIHPSNYDFNDHSDIQITTSDTTYKLMAENYFFINDTLFISSAKNTDEHRRSEYQIRIPLKEIKMIEVEKTNVIATIFHSYRCSVFSFFGSLSNRLGFCRLQFITQPLFITF